MSQFIPNQTLTAMNAPHCLRHLPVRRGWEGSESVVASCCSCAEFLASDRTPSVGLCLLHAVRVLAQDNACSHYDWDDRFEPVGSDDEF